MGAPVSDMKAAEQATPEALLSAFKTISAAERRKHATVFNYWLSIRGDRDFASIRDLDPLELSDAASGSILLELIGGGEEAEIRHVGDSLKGAISVAKLSEASSPSLLSCIGAKLAIVAISRNVLAFEDEFDSPDGPTRCQVTLLPFSSSGTWVDYVYAFVTSGTASDQAAGPAEVVADEPAAEPPLAPEPAAEEPATQEIAPADEGQAIAEPVEEPAAVVESPADEQAEAVPDAPEAAPTSAPESPEPSPEEPSAEGTAGFSSKVFDAIAGVQGFFGAGVSVEPKLPKAAAEKLNEPKLPKATAEKPGEPIERKTECRTEGTLQSKLEEVRSKADEARMAKLRANAALYEGLSAVYDFALDAEEQPEEYLKLVGEKGLKIQLRDPMAPVVKLAFDGLCDESTIGQLEAVLIWAFQQDLARGSLAERIEAEGGIAAILNGPARAAA